MAILPAQHKADVEDLLKSSIEYINNGVVELTKHKIFQLFNARTRWLAIKDLIIQPDL